MTNISALFARSIQCLSSTVMVMMSLMNPSIDASVSLMSTSRGSAFERCFTGCCSSSFGSKVLCGELRFSVSQDYSLSRSFPKSIANFLIVVYSSVVSVVPKGNHG